MKLFSKFNVTLLQEVKEHSKPLLMTFSEVKLYESVKKSIKNVAKAILINAPRL